VFSLSVIYSSLFVAFISAITVVVVGNTNPFFKYSLNNVLEVGLMTTDDYESLRFDD